MSLYKLGATTVPTAPTPAVPVKVVESKSRLGDVVVGVCTGVVSSLLVNLIMKGRR